MEIRKTSFAEYEAALKPPIDQIARQYRTIASIFDLFWKEVSLRSNYNSWRQDSQRVGSCNIDRDISEGGLCDPTKEHLIMLRELRNQETSGFQFGDACPYHRLEVGCVLGDLKSPLCLNHVDSHHGSEMRQRLRFSPFDMYIPLCHILLGGIDPKKASSKPDPAKNAEYVRSLLTNTITIINHVRTFPILHPEEIPWEASLQTAT